MKILTYLKCKYKTMWSQVVIAKITCLDDIRKMEIIYE